MARTTAHPDHRCVSSNDVQGTEVYAADGKHVGEVDHLIIDKLSGRVAYAVISFGGFMGSGHSHYPIPWSALSYDTSARRVSYEHHGAAAEGYASIQRRQLAGPRLGDAYPSALPSSSILGSDDLKDPERAGPRERVGAL